MIQIEHQGRVIATNVVLADTFFARLAGYMFRTRPHVAGFLFEPAPSIHTFFMNFPLDVVFLDTDARIIKVYRNLRPWRHTGFFFAARRTLELPAGQFPGDLGPGAVLEVRHV
jgi:uncharacterized membrane protein (UPF0127 family)